jgi:hypothetical protein
VQAVIVICFYFLVDNNSWKILSGRVITGETMLFITADLTLGAGAFFKFLHTLYLKCE